jgi:hypothetical protein
MGEGYHDNQGDEGNPMGKVPNKGVGSTKRKTNSQEMIGMTAIREKRGIQWDMIGIK